MYRKEVNAQSPVRILDTSIHGGLGKGNLGVVMARAGVGKTAALIQIGLDDLMRDRPVLHVALGQTVEHVQCWYDALFGDMAKRTNLEHRDVVAATVAAKRIIQSFPDQDLSPERLRKTVEMFKEHLNFRPAAVLVDGFDWSAHSIAENAAQVGAFKAYAKLIDVALFLEPNGDDVTVRLLKDHDDAVPPATHLHLHPQTLRLVVGDEDRTTEGLPRSAYTLLSGGAPGSETDFGQCAERWGLTELTYSFEGRRPARTRGLVNLDEDELAEGAVSPVYIEAQMHRRFPNTPLFRKTLQSIWHQVQTAGELFVVGVIQPDGTVKGGTGWAAELGRHWGKPVYVFDQARNSWVKWTDGQWADADAPVITRPRFTGTGTRNITDEGRAAIVALFERSFGPAPE
jgi:hypothetical protein